MKRFVVLDQGFSFSFLSCSGNLYGSDYQKPKLRTMRLKYTEYRLKPVRIYVQYNLFFRYIHVFIFVNSRFVPIAGFIFRIKFFRFFSDCPNSKTEKTLTLNMESVSGPKLQ